MNKNMHLGNVRASISDRRQFSSTIFDAVITDATDYFPFGAPNRSVSSSAGYRYGFNGKELDKSNEFGTANVYDYGFRIYNPSIGRFLSVDPLTRSYPELTPYQFASNTPIWAVDLDGLEAMYKISYEEMLKQIKVTRHTEAGTNSVTIHHVYNGNMTKTTISDDGPTQNEVESNKLGSLFSGNANILSAANTLTTGFPGFINGANRNSVGVIMRQMLLNAGEISDAGDNNAVENNKYANGILHFTGQAIFSALFDEESAKYAADIHERSNTSFFLGEPPANSPSEVFDDYADVYKDLVNNKYGRLFGTQLKSKYKNLDLTWTVETTKNVLNDIQDYLSKSWGLKFKDFEISNAQLIKFTKVINASRPRGR